MLIPQTVIEFNSRFNTEEECKAFLAKLRWPDGFICPNCSHDDGHLIESRALIQCYNCRKQTSVTAGTLFHRTQIPLQIWFYIIHCMTQDKGGASSTRLAAALGMRQATVWHIQQKIRQAMGRRDQSIMLAGFVEMDEAIIGPHARRDTRSKKDDDDESNKTSATKKFKVRKQPGRGRPKKVGKNEKTQTPVLIFAEQEPGEAGFVAMKVLDSVSRENVLEFAEARVDKFQHIKTDGFSAHHVLRTFDCTYEAIVCGGPDGCTELPIVHRVISLLKTDLMGTFFGVSVKHLQSYLYEFAFRFNRKGAEIPIWLSALRACIFSNPYTYAELIV
jgi:transposase-like protein